MNTVSLKSFKLTGPFNIIIRFQYHFKDRIDRKLICSDNIRLSTVIPNTFVPIIINKGEN